MRPTFGCSTNLGYLHLWDGGYTFGRRRKAGGSAFDLSKTASLLWTSCDNSLAECCRQLRTSSNGRWPLLKSTGARVDSKNKGCSLFGLNPIMRAGGHRRSPPKDARLRHWLRLKVFHFSSRVCKSFRLTIHHRTA